MKYALPTFAIVLSFILSSGKLAAQNTQYDTARLNIGATENTEKPKPVKINSNTKAKDKDNDGFAIVASTALLYSFNDAIKDTFPQKAVFMPTFALYFGKKTAAFIEVGLARAFKQNRKSSYENLHPALSFMTVGICNQVKLNDRMSFRQKFGLTALLVRTEYFYLPGSPLHGGFTAGAGLQTKATENLILYFDANYMYQANNLGGLRLEPGIMLQF